MDKNSNGQFKFCLPRIYLLIAICLYLLEFGSFHINEGQPCHPPSQIFLKFGSYNHLNMKTNPAKFFYVILSRSRDMGI